MDDVDAHYANARERGASVESEPKDQPYGQREYGAKDLRGTGGGSPAR
jgi:MerR family transcriptional regulator, thiopeptide resistance regulator